MQNRIPQSVGGLMTKAAEMAAGANQYGGTIPLQLITEPLLRANITTMSEANGGIGQGRKELKTRYAAARTKLIEARAFLTLARDTFKPKLGSEYNLQWNNVGLIGSLVIPTNTEKVMSVLRAVNTFLTNNPPFESTVNGTTITAPVTEALLNQLETTRANINVQKKLIRDLIADRDTKAEVLAKSMRDLIAELTIQLKPLDSRWVAFGLNMPGAQPTPEVPANVTVNLLGTNALSVKWEPSTYADYYRVWLMVEGVDEELVNIDDTTNLEFTIQALTAGAQVQVAVSAVSTGGESQQSEPITVAIPK